MEAQLRRMGAKRARGEIALGKGSGERPAFAPDAQRCTARLVVAAHAKRRLPISRGRLQQPHSFERSQDVFGAAAGEAVEQQALAPGPDAE
jgi:hypothetical protein